MLYNVEIIFPTGKEVIQKIDTKEQIEKMKRNSFLNATNTNFLPKAMREFYLENVS